MTQVTDTSEVLKVLQNLQSDIQDIKLSQVRTEEQIKAIQHQMTDMNKSIGQRITDLDKSLNKRIDSLEQRSNGQETRFWGLVAILSTALLGIVGKLAFFPINKV